MVPDKFDAQMIGSVDFMCDSFNHLVSHFVSMYCALSYICNKNGYKDKCALDHHDFLSQDELNTLQSAKQSIIQAVCSTWLLVPKRQQLSALLYLPLGQFQWKCYKSVMDIKFAKMYQ